MGTDVRKYRVFLKNRVSGKRQDFENSVRLSVFILSILLSVCIYKGNSFTGRGSIPHSFLYAVTDTFVKIQCPPPQVEHANCLTVEIFIYVTFP